MTNENEPVYNPATQPTNPPPASNQADAPGANVPIGTTLANLSHGAAPDSVGTGPGSAIGAGGLGATGTRDLTEADANAAASITGNTATVGGADSPAQNVPVTGAGMGTGNAGQTGGNTLSGGSNAGTA